MGTVRRKHIPNRLFKYRKLAGYSQKDAAHLIGLASATRLSRWERGLAYPSVPNLLKLCVLYSTLPTALYYDLYANYRDEVDILRQSFKRKPSSIQDETFLS